MSISSTQPRIEPHRLRPERIRRAVPHDISALTELTERSMRELGTNGYTQHQIESALLHLTHIDPRLITDGTYFVAEGPRALPGPRGAGGSIVGGAGWTRRSMPHGVVRREHAARYELWLASTTDAARIRAVYVHPLWARKGIGRRLVGMCERAAQHAGYTELALLASLGGVPLYRACGYEAHAQLDFVLPDGTILPTVAMWKSATS